MEKENSEPQFVYNDSLNNVIIIGDLQLRSPYVSIQDLAIMALEMLKQEPIKDYLEARKMLKKSGGTGLG